MSLTLTVDRSGIPSWQKFRWEDAAAIWSREATPLGLAMLRAHTPFGQGHQGAGRLRQSTSSREEPGPGSLMITFYTTVPYARYVIGGTRPHPIAARNARALHWLGPGGIGDHFARRVNHPGNRPNPYPERVMALIGPEVARLFAEAVKEAMEL